ncbi:MAG: DnaB-like helicase C-terminal domain-containing protein [Cetobacterium sp.]|uniref:DnaB-like helicase C-terminal domain-containing protein n=1 Tax=Cetobacterium sp. TaxID=2071632 RepID=UPI003EE5C15A
MQISTTIFSNLLYNQEYFRIVWPHLKSEYFNRGAERITFSLIKKYVDKYETLPTTNALLIELDNKSTISGTDYDETKNTLASLVNAPEDLKWLVDTTEKYCQDKSLYEAVARVAEIQDNAALPLDEQDTRLPGVGAIPDLLRDALAVCFDTSVGHDYFGDYETRWDMYNKKVGKLSFAINILNKITKGGVERRTLNLILAGVNVGKSLTLCSLAADYLTQGHNVLYISMEMAEEVVCKRIDANLINISMDDFETLTGGSYKAKIEALSKRNKIGNLIVKQFPTGGASVSNFNALMQELKTKKGWQPDVVMVDYLGICCSSRLKTFSENSYAMVKAIAEELRGFAIRWNVAVWSGAQTNRNGWNSTDVEMGDIAESAGLAATADFILALMETDELAEMKQYFCKQIKSRYGDKSINAKFNLGVDKGKQRIYELEDSAASPQAVAEISREMNVQAKHNAYEAAEVQKTKREMLDDFSW